MLDEKILEMRGMRRQEIIDYFDAFHKFNYDKNASIFRGEQIVIELSEEFYASLGSIKIPSTIVKFIGEKETIEQAIYHFRLRFLTAGG